MAVARSRNKFEQLCNSAFRRTTTNPTQPPGPGSPFHNLHRWLAYKDMVSHSSASNESASSNDTVRPFNAEISDSEQAQQDVSRWLQTSNPNVQKLYNLALNVTNHSRSNGHKILEALVGDVQVLLTRERLAERTPPPKLESALFLDGEPRRIRVDSRYLVVGS